MSRIHLSALLLWYLSLGHRAWNAEGAFFNNTAPNSKEYMICSVRGGLELARSASRQIHNIFLESLEDVELIREYISERMTLIQVDPWQSPSMITLDDLAHTLDWRARGLPENSTTVDAGLGYVDDRPDRTIDRRVPISDHPLLVGNKSSDLATLDVVAPLLPWVYDRRSKEDFWYRPHQNGRSEGIGKDALLFDRLYDAVFFFSCGAGIAYYPALSASLHPFTLGDVLGESHPKENVTAMIAAWPREAVLTKPFTDYANRGRSILSAQAPVYYTGSWYGLEYDDTPLGAVGIDITIASIATILESFDSRVASGSFAMVVDLQMSVYVITQNAVNLIYPERTGVEDFRLIRDTVTNRTISDRRNQTYLVTDTVLQSPLDLTNADWKSLHDDVLQLQPGGRGSSSLNITLTGNSKPTAYYAMYDRWTSLSYLHFVLFAPIETVENAVACRFNESELALQIQQGTRPEKQYAVVLNEGTMDVVISLTGAPSWITLVDDPLATTAQGLQAGQSRRVEFEIDSDSMSPGLTSATLTLSIEDDDYPNCFRGETISMTVSVVIATREDTNQIGSLRIYGFVLNAIVLVTSLYFAQWVHFNADRPIVRASQPIFLYLLCVGTAIMGSSLVPLAMDDSLLGLHGCDMACMSFPWLAAVGFSVSFASLFCKIYRVQILFEAGVAFHRRQVGASEAVVPFGILLGLNVAILVPWTIVDPLVFSRIPTSENSSYGTCWSDLSAAQIAFLTLLALLNVSALLTANVQAFRARNIADEYSESRYIGMAMASQLQVFLIGVPVMFLVVDNPPAFFFVQSSLVFILSMALLLLIFVPKQLYLRKHQGASEREENVILSEAAHRSVLSARAAQSGSDDDDFWGDRSNTTMTVNRFSAAPERPRVPSAHNSIPEERAKAGNDHIDDN